PPSAYGPPAIPQRIGTRPGLQPRARRRRVMPFLDGANAMRRFVAFASLFLLACGGDDDGGGGGVKVPDASMPKIDAPPANCAAQADYGTPTPLAVGALRFCETEEDFVPCPNAATQGVFGTKTNPTMIAYFAQLNAQNDVLSVELWQGAPPFDTGP